jgi:NTP pyrophosphatase (non-canonical NTP hydrolase)
MKLIKFLTFTVFPIIIVLLVFLNFLLKKKGKNFIYPTLGLMGEAGEVAEKIKKVIRDKKSKLDLNTKLEIKKELGDVLWYLSQLATELDLDLEDVASLNLEKLFSRQKRNQLKGSGDNR